MHSYPRSAKTFFAAITACTLATLPTGIATAAERDSFSHAVQVSELQPNEEELLANDLEVLFTRYVQLGSDEIFRVNESNLISDGFSNKILALQHLATALNHVAKDGASGNENRFDGQMTEIQGAGSFALCVLLNGFGIPAAGASPGLVAAIKQGIRAWNWGLTARTVARILGPAAVKALGGPVGIGVALGWAAWSCRGQL